MDNIICSFCIKTFDQLPYLNVQLPAWNKIEAKVLSQAEKSAAMRRFVRFFIGRATECTCDKQGRVLIPPELRNYAKLEKDVVLAGVLDRFEIWSRKNWDNEHNLMEDDLMQFKGKIAHIKKREDGKFESGVAFIEMDEEKTQYKDTQASPSGTSDSMTWMITPGSLVLLIF